MAFDPATDSQIQFAHKLDAARLTTAHSTPDTTNPKDLLGVKKVGLDKLPPVASAHFSDAMMDGGEKYGPYNWRDKKVRASIYYAAAMRHLSQWWDGEETAEDSGVHHLGHAGACAAILLDAQEHDCLLDDRPRGDQRVSRVYNRIKERRAKG